MWDNLACVLAIHQRQQLQSLFKVKLVFDVFQNFYDSPSIESLSNPSCIATDLQQRLRRVSGPMVFGLGGRKNGICCLVISLAILALFMR